MKRLQRMPGLRQFSDWRSYQKERSRLELQMLAVSAEFGAAPSEEDDPSAYHEARDKAIDTSDKIQRRLDSLETRRLLPGARRFDIATPNSWLMTPHQRKLLRKQIRAARFEYWQAWTNLALPVVGLIVSFFSLWISFLALYKK